MDSNVCKACSSNCISCSNVNLCLSCQNNYVLGLSSSDIICASFTSTHCFNSLNSLCTVCDVGYLLDNTPAYPICGVCVPNCKNCQTPTICLQCADKYYPVGTTSCLPCSSNCLTCTDNTKCLTC